MDMMTIGLALAGVVALSIAFGVGFRVGGERGYRDGYTDCKRVNDPKNYSLTRHHADGRRVTTFGDGSKSTYEPPPPSPASR